MGCEDGEKKKMKVRVLVGEVYGFVRKEKWGLVAFIEARDGHHPHCFVYLFSMPFF